jgi:hypothetical protein
MRLAAAAHKELLLQGVFCFCNVATLQQNTKDAVPSLYRRAASGRRMAGKMACNNIRN